MIKIIGDKYPAFVLCTDNTSYVIKIIESGHPAHLYYGRRVEFESEDNSMRGVTVQAAYKWEFAKQIPIMNCAFGT